MLPEAGAFELIFLAAVALIVVGPKDLPVLLRKIGQFVAKMRGLAAEFRASFDELARQSELDELRKEVEALKHARIEPQITQDIQSEMGGLHEDMSSYLQTGGQIPNPALTENNSLAAEPAPKVRRSRSAKKPAFEPVAAPADAAKPERAARKAAKRAASSVAAEPAPKRSRKAAERTG